MADIARERQCESNIERTNSRTDSSHFLFIVCEWSCYMHTIQSTGLRRIDSNECSSELSDVTAQQTSFLHYCARSVVTCKWMRPTLAQREYTTVHWIRPKVQSEMIWNEVQQFPNVSTSSDSRYLRALQFLDTAAFLLQWLHNQPLMSIFSSHMLLSATILGEKIKAHRSR